MTSNPMTKGKDKAMLPARWFDAAMCKVYGHGAPNGPWTCPKCGKQFLRAKAAAQ